MVGSKNPLRIFSGFLLAAAMAACDRQDAGEIRIGAYASLTGVSAATGHSARKGLGLAVDSINASGGILGRKVRLIIEDDHGRPDLAAAAVDRLIDASGVSAVIGGLDSSITLAAAEVCQRKRVPMVSPASTIPEVTRIGDNIFGICFLGPFQGQVMARFARSNLKLLTAAVLRDSASGSSMLMADRFKEYFFHADGDILADQGYRHGDTDFTAQLEAIRAKDPHVIFIPAGFPDIEIIASRARRLGIRSVLLGGEGWDSPGIRSGDGAALGGGYYASRYSAENPRPGLRRFVLEYAARHGRSGDSIPDAVAALSYDAANLVFDAIKRSGSLRPGSVRESLATTRQFPGITGDITLDLERNAVKQAVVFEVRARSGGKVRSAYRDFLAP